jgi:hypothetical protein
LESLQRGVDGTERDVSTSLPFDLLRDRHAVRVVPESQYGEHDQQFKFAEIVWFWHFFDYIEEICARPAASLRHFHTAPPRPFHGSAVWLQPTPGHRLPVEVTWQTRLGRFWKAHPGQFSQAPKHKPNRSIKEVLALPVHRRFRELLSM